MLIDFARFARDSKSHPTSTGDNFTFCPLVNDPNRTLGHTRFVQQARPHMPGDDPWGMFEIVLLLAIAICIFISAALAVA
jgi:hypothetical protein